MNVNIEPLHPKKDSAPEIVELESGAAIRLSALDPAGLAANILLTSTPRAAYIWAGMPKMGNAFSLDENAMSALEAQIPELAAGAVKFAYLQALTSGAKVLEVVDDQLVETSADGSTRFIKALPPSHAVVAGSKKRLRPV